MPVGEKHQPGAWNFEVGLVLGGVFLFFAEYQPRGKSNGIIVDEKNKIPRDQLNPPEKPGNSPTFKEDGKKVELHHQDQNPDGPIIEMHPSKHRGKVNDAVNHPNKNKPSLIDRKKFNKDRRDYWKNEFPSESTIIITPRG